MEGKSKERKLAFALLTSYENKVLSLNLKIDYVILNNVSHIFLV